MALPADRDHVAHGWSTLSSALLGSIIGCLIVILLVAGIASWFAHTTSNKTLYFDVAEPAMIDGFMLGVPTFVVIVALCFRKS